MWKQEYLDLKKRFLHIENPNSKRDIFLKDIIDKIKSNLPKISVYLLFIHRYFRIDRNPAQFFPSIHIFRGIPKTQHRLH